MWNLSIFNVLLFSQKVKAFFWIQEKGGNGFLPRPQVGGFRRVIFMKKEHLPGWASMLVLAWIATQSQALVEVGGKHPVEAAVIAIVVGVLLRNTKRLPAVLDPGIKAFQTPLIVGIILYGSTLSFSELVGQGARILTTVIVTMMVGFFAIYLVARMFKLPRKLSILLSVGTTICGGSAIAVTSPLIEAKEEETSYAITTIALWGLVAILLYPFAARSMDTITDQAFGIFAGTAIHSTPQVVGAAMIYSEAAGKVATAVKLVRNCFMIPLAFFISIWYARNQTIQTGERGQAPSERKKMDAKKAFPWYLFAFFVMAILGTKGFFTDTGLAHFKAWGKFLILTGMAGIGMNTRFSVFKGIGVKPFIVGLIGSAIVAAVSVVLIWVLNLS